MIKIILQTKDHTCIINYSSIYCVLCCWQLYLFQNSSHVLQIVIPVSKKSDGCEIPNSFVSYLLKNILQLLNSSKIWNSQYRYMNLNNFAYLFLQYSTLIIMSNVLKVGKQKLTVIDHNYPTRNNYFIRPITVLNLHKQFETICKKVVDTRLV